MRGQARQTCELPIAGAYLRARIGVSVFSKSSTADEISLAVTKWTEVLPRGDWSRVEFRGAVRRAQGPAVP